jgi:hypothetical protein
MVYVGTLMTENAFYPIFLWFAFALVVMLERPTLRSQLIVLALGVLAFETRAQAVALFAAALTAPLALAWIERGRPRSLKAFAPLYGVVAGAVVLVAIVEAVRGRSPAAILGSYSKTSNGGYHVWPVIRWLVLHVAELDLSLFVLPFAAVIVLVANARHLDRRLRIFTAAVASVSVWLVLEVAVFASQYSHRVEERNFFYLAPLFLLGLLAWIERGQPRPPRAAIAAAGLAAALPGAIPFLSLLNITSQSDTIGLQPWWYLGDGLAGGNSVALVAVLLSLALGAAFLWLGPRHAPLLPVVVALGFLVTWLPLQLWTHSFPRLGSSAYHQGIGGQRSWIDAAVGRDAHVGVVWSGGNVLAVWENEFWNRSVDRVYDLGGPLPGDMPETHVTANRSTGVLHDADGHTVSEPYVLTHSSVELVGTPVASDPEKRLVLYRVEMPARTTTQITGLYDDTWSTGHVAWRRSQCSGGVLKVALRSDTNLFKGVIQTLAISGTTPATTLHLAPSQQPMLRLPLTPVNGVCRVDFRITPTRSPGASDPRQLGLHFDSIRYVHPKK